jgi:uncharacterized protein (DUF433 family)
MKRILLDMLLAARQAMTFMENSTAESFRSDHLVQNAVVRVLQVLGDELLEEAIRMRRASGVIFADGPTGRRAVVAGTGLDVWEIVATWHGGSDDFDQLRRNYEWLTEPQLRAALAYYKLYPDEIDARLSREAEWTPERIKTELPFAHPRTR